MPKLERQEEIRRFIYEVGQASVQTLSERFGVSEATIRRDLEEMAAKGTIRRLHGGATRPRSAATEPPILQRVHERAALKELIGKAAAGLVADGETIFLGSGSTTLAVARHLLDRQDLTVITNSLPVVNLLADAPHITLIILGGLLRHSERSMIGHITEQAIAELRADKVIMGIQAVDLQQGLTNAYLPETMTDRAIVNLAPQLILVADHTKFGRIAPSLVAPLEAVHTVVTDAKIDPQIVRDLQEAGIRVIVAGAESNGAQVFLPALDAAQPPRQ